MVDVALSAHNWIDPFLYPERTATPNLDTLLRAQLNGATPASLPAINAALKELDALKAVWG
jgi:hypothetical protein